jgi:hypothetical protein
MKYPATRKAVPMAIVEALPTRNKNATGKLFPVAGLGRDDPDRRVLGSGAMLLAFRLAGLSALVLDYAVNGAGAQSGRRATENSPAGRRTYNQPGRGLQVEARPITRWPG